MFQSFIVGEVEHLFEEVDPEDGLHRPVGTAVVHAVHGSKALLVNQGERLVSENLGPTSLQALSLLRRHQELGLPEALLRVSYSEHPPLPRPGAAPTTFYYIIPTLPQDGEGFLRTNQSYIARNEEPNLWAGGKQAFLDRIQFLEVPAAESKIAGLRTGQFDVVLNAPLSFFEILRDDTNIEISTPLGNFATIDINASLPPTENVLARQAILAATNIEDFMDALSPRELWFRCSSRYVCGTIWESTAGMDAFYDQNDLPKAQQLLKDSGYAGEPLVLWAPTDNQVLTDIGVVAAPMLEAIGFTVEFPAQDWATLVSKLGDGTWNIIADFWGVGFRGSPLRDPMVAGTFINSFVSPKMQQLQLDLIRAGSLEEQQQLVDEINLAFFEEVPTVSFGQFKLIYPHRTYVRGLQQVALPSFYNAWLDE